MKKTTILITNPIAKAKTIFSNTVVSLPRDMSEKRTSKNITIAIKTPLTIILIIRCFEALKFAIKTLIMTSTRTVSITISYRDNLQISQLKKQLS